MLNFIRVASLGILLSGCANDRPRHAAKATAPILFVCGCTPCNELVRATERTVLARCTLTYRGSPGDARQFSQVVQPPLHVKSDPRGEYAKQNGVETCPALVTWNERGERTTLGNGKPLTPLDLVASTEDN